MATIKRRWLPREGIVPSRLFSLPCADLLAGFTADIIQRVIQKTVLNPYLTVPLFLLAKYTSQGQGYALDHPSAFSRLRVFLYISLFRWFNGALSQATLDNFTDSKYDWSKRESVLVTGGSEGIGALLVKLFAAKGVKVVILDRQAPTFPIPDSQKELVHWLPCDLTSVDDIGLACEQARSRFGHPTILIHNAGITNHHTILRTPDHLLQRVFAVNTLAHYRVTKQFLPHMISTNHGTVVTVASLAGFVTVPGLTDYCGTKAAAVAFHEGLTEELRERYNAPKIRTVCVCPNFVDTKLSRGFVNPSRFTSPTLHPETIAEAIFAKVMDGSSGYVVVPKTHEWAAMSIRGMPHWLQWVLRHGQKDTMRKVEEEQEARDRETSGKEPEPSVAVGKEGEL